MTNADNIRRMSDYELMKILFCSPINCTDVCPDFAGGCDATCKHDHGRDYIKEWLAQEA